MNQFAPVVIPTLNRYEHLKRCVESLAACTDADKTDLYIALDYPFKEEHWDGYRKIKSYISDIKGFRSVNIINRDTNYGVVKNLFDALSFVFKLSDKIIMSEDDNEFSNDFLSFLNKGLNVYKERDDIFSICGYNYPVIINENYLQDIYIWKGFSAWGIGIWKEKWEKVDFSEKDALNKVYKFLLNLNYVIKYNRTANHYIPNLIKMLKEKTLHGDGYINMYQFLNKMYCVFPTISRVRNFGHDGSGAHCNYTESDLYREQEIYYGNDSCEFPIKIEPDEKINRILKSHFKRSFKSKIKTAAKLLSLRLGSYNPSK
jgi:hypothetical protein